MAARKTHRAKNAKSPSAHIVRAEDEETFLKQINKYFDEGYRPIQEMAMFAELDRKTGKWRTLYILPLVHYEEFKDFQSIPMSGEKEEERMFG